MVFTVAGCALQSRDSEFSESAQYQSGKFRNQIQQAPKGASSFFKAATRYLLAKRVNTEPSAPIPLIRQSRQSLEQANSSDAAIYRLGHSTLLLFLEQKYWLIDPVFSERASPLSWVGPKRFHPVPIELNDLPDIAGVIISHDHYDHLDKQTIKQLKDKVPQFIVPLGVGNHLQEWGVESNQIKELDWWQHHTQGDVKFTATPAQHFSGRSLSDNNQTLWASWVIQSKDQSIFFSGDSGYFEGFKEIGRRFGPFDLTIMENGAYDASWSDVHMTPEETLQAHIDLKGEALMPVHNGTFDLALHPWYEPFERLSALADQQSLSLLTPIMGERLSIDKARSTKTQAWWKTTLAMHNLEPLQNR